MCCVALTFVDGASLFPFTSFAIDTLFSFLCLGFVLNAIAFLNLAVVSGPGLSLV